MREGLRIALAIARRLAGHHAGTPRVRSGGSGWRSEFIVEAPLPREKERERCG